MTDKPTCEQILAEPAGRQMDAWIAKFVMEHEIYEFPAGVINNLLYFSTDIAAAWRVVEKISKIHFGLNIVQWYSGKGTEIEWHVALGNGQTKVGIAQADTAPLAICRAALLVVLER